MARMKRVLVIVLALSSAAWADQLPEPSPPPPDATEPRRQPPGPDDGSKLPPPPERSEPIDDPFLTFTGSNPGARILFEEAKHLTRDGNTAAACGKLAESWKLQEAVSTQLGLARCRENEGKVGEAWRLYHEAARRSQEAGFAHRGRLALQAAKPLEEKLATLVIRLAPPIAPGTTIAVNDHTLQSTLAAELRELVDPGDVVVHAKGPTGVASRSVVRVFPKTVFRVDVPTLQEREGGREPLWIAGSAVLVVGGVLAAGAGSGAVRLVGGAAIVGGVAMFLLAPKKRVMAVPMVITNETAGGGVAVAGHF